MSGARPAADESPTSQLVRLDTFRREHDRWLVIVLDACRYDLLARYLERRDHDIDIERVRSPALYSGEWARAAWRGQQLQDVTYITGNAYWRSGRAETEYQPDDHLGEVVHFDKSDPEPIRDATLDRQDADALVAHFMQPHVPYLGSDVGRLNPADDPLWKWYKGYIETLDYGWQHGVTPLVEAFDRPIVITADHGEALGPLDRDGSRGEYWMHGQRRDYPEVRYVPWIEVHGQTPEADELSDVPTDRLRDLGYLD